MSEASNDDMPAQCAIEIRGKINDKGQAMLSFEFGHTPDMNDGKGRPDKTLPAMHFLDWMQRNQQSLVNIWHAEYAQYLNLRRATEGGGAPPALPLVDANGGRLQ